MHHPVPVIYEIREIGFEVIRLRSRCIHQLPDKIAKCSPLQFFSAR
ncbi:hypothetical protein LF41_1310 [Lysobacter dokdonensis DS-58]|uniref:Uncharacterized protein n=1 Tax=Lysobacter dokdonensis DS-58 TaxID=1300345 RepID=A0A0A2WR49_9GAMM|nr:hypothetical protein LF41_1310 [Lysobacter dokdonensis DS-58]